MFLEAQKNATRKHSKLMSMFIFCPRSQREYTCMCFIHVCVCICMYIYAIESRGAKKNKK